MERTIGPTEVSCPHRMLVISGHASSRPALGWGVAAPVISAELYGPAQYGSSLMQHVESGHDLLQAV
jgi:hypothetical protein